ncbi:MAG: nuclear transport factor 2 family protein [Emcibacter sp.]|nr:nuclear transport factor 2 family protein [Emcibacter sp.]
MQDDVSKIREIMDLYGFAVDTRRWDLFDKIFAPKMHADYGGEAVWTDLENFKDNFEVFHSILTSTQHFMANFMHNIKGDKATTVTYGHWVIVRNGMKDGDVWRGYGWYNDELKRGKQGWRIIHRKLRIISWEGNSNILNPEGDVGDDSFKVPIEVTSLYAESQAGRIPLLVSLDEA